MGIYVRTIGALLAGTLVLSACSLPGTTIVSQEPTPSSQLSEADIEATVQARLDATQAAQQATSPTTSLADPTQAPTQAPMEAQTQIAQLPTTPVEQPTASPPSRTRTTLQEPTTPPTSSVAPTTAATQPTSAAAATSVSASAAFGGDGVIAIGRASISALGPTGWMQPVAHSAGNECTNPAAAIAGDGTAYATCASRMYTNRGGDWAEDDTLVNSYNLFRDGQGGVWVIGYDTAKRIDGDNIQTFDAQTAVGDSSFDIEHAAFAPDGTAYFVSSSIANNQLVSFDGTNWRHWGKDFGFEEPLYSINAIVATAQGEVLVGSTNGVYTLNEGKVTPLLGYEQFAQAINFAGDQRFVPYVQQLVQTPDGILWIGTEKEGVFAWDGTTLTPYDRTNGLPSNKITALDVDNAGRLWVGTSYGLAVRDNNTWQVVQPSTGGIADSFMVAIAVSGAPALPAPEPAKTTSITGQVTENKQPLSGATVALCSEHPELTDALRYRINWICENHTYQATTQTDDEGRYRFENVPLGTYVVIIADNTKGQYVVPTLYFTPALTPNQEVVQNLDYTSN